MNTVLLKDPRIDINPPGDLSHVVYQGAARITSYTQTGTVNDTECQFNFQPPSSKIITDRRMMLKVTFTVSDVTGTNDFFNFAAAGSAMRQAPLASIMDNLEVRINGGSTNSKISDRIHAMLRYGNIADDRNKYFSKTACMPDAFQEYGDAGAEPGGSGRDPLATFGVNSSQQTRAGFPFVTSVGSLAATKSATFTVTEPLFLSPMLTGFEHQDQGLVNVSNININIKWASDLKRIMSVRKDAAINDITGFKVSITKADLLTTFMTPPNTMPIPSLQIIPHTVYNRHIKQAPTLASNASVDVVSETVKLNQIPKHLLVYAKMTNPLFTDTDAFARINKIDILWNNENSIMTTTTTEGLYDIAVSNGCNLMFAEWSKYVGSCLLLQFGKDIGLPSGLAPGTLGQFVYQATVNITNLSSVAKDFTLYTFEILEGTLEISENAIASNLGLLTYHDVVDATFNAPSVHHLDSEVTGGSFWSSMKHIINKVSRGFQKGAQFADKLTPLISKFNPEVGAAVGAISQGAGTLGSIGRAATGGGRMRSTTGKYKRNTIAAYKALKGGSASGGSSSGGSRAGGRRYVTGGRMN